MSRYQHTKGQIKDNAIEALLHDPLFRQRVEKNKKGKRPARAGRRNSCHAWKVIYAGRRFNGIRPSAVVNFLHHHTP